MHQAEELTGRHGQPGKLLGAAEKAFDVVAVTVDKPQNFAFVFADEDYLRAWSRDGRYQSVRIVGVVGQYVVRTLDGS